MTLYKVVSFTDITDGPHHEDEELFLHKNTALMEFTRQKEIVNKEYGEKPGYFVAEDNEDLFSISNSWDDFGVYLKEVNVNTD